MSKNYSEMNEKELNEELIKVADELDSIKRPNNEKERWNKLCEKQIAIQDALYNLPL